MRPASKDTKSAFRNKPGPKPKKIKEDKESNKLVRSRTDDSPMLWL